MRVEKQNALFEAYIKLGLRIFRSGATSYGDYRTTHSLDRFRSRKSAGNMRKPMTFLARLRAIPTNGMSDNAC